MSSERLPVAVDAMGGDFAPGPIVAGAKQAAAAGIPVLLVGDPEQLGDVGDLEVLAASDVIPMDTHDPASAVRSRKDASVVRCAVAVKEGIAGSMVSAGNTGAAMASALLRMGRIKGLQRPAIATPIPLPHRPSHPNVLIDAGANAEVQPDWLVQFAAMGAVFARDRYGVERPRVGLLSIGEEAGKGTPLIREAHELLVSGDWDTRSGAEFIGNVEGRDLMNEDVDVIVADGFTGNVALKTAEGVAGMLVQAISEAFDSSDEARRGAELLMPALLPLYEAMDPDSVGGACLLGVRGPCIIAHGSSREKAIHNAIQVAWTMDEADVVGHLREVLGGG